MTIGGDATATIGGATEMTGGTAIVTAMTADGGMAMATTIEMTDGAVTVITTATGIVTAGTGRN